MSPACDNCYARVLAGRFGTGWGESARRKFFGEKHWQEPLRWQRAAKNAGVRRRVFCASMGDVFERLPRGHPDRETMAAARSRLWSLIMATPDLDWLLLTKRPQLIAAPLRGHRVPGNVWLGVTVENAAAEWRVPMILRIAAPVHFISYEPALGELTWNADWFSGPADQRVNWIICGGESGSNREKVRPMHPDWARQARDAAKRYGAAFHLKQWGNWCPLEGGFGGWWYPSWSDTLARDEPTRLCGDDLRVRGDGYRWHARKGDVPAMLDGREWREFPEVTP